MAFLQPSTLLPLLLPPFVLSLSSSPLEKPPLPTPDRARLQHTHSQHPVPGLGLAVVAVASVMTGQ